MPRWSKLLIGLAAAWLAAFIHYWPMGGGEAFIQTIERPATTRVAFSRIPGVDVRMQRDPLARVAIFSGPADRFQKEGLNDYPGLNDRILAIPGVAGFRWEE
jgi:hypothetical protein